MSIKIFYLILMIFGASCVDIPSDICSGISQGMISHPDPTRCTEFILCFLGTAHLQRCLRPNEIFYQPAQDCVAGDPNTCELLITTHPPTTTTTIPEETTTTLPETTTTLPETTTTLPETTTTLPDITTTTEEPTTTYVPTTTTTMPDIPTTTTEEPTTTTTIPDIPTEEPTTTTTTTYVPTTTTTMPDIPTTTIPEETTTTISEITTTEEPTTTTTIPDIPTEEPTTTTTTTQYMPTTTTTAGPEITTPSTVPTTQPPLGPPGLCVGHNLRFVANPDYCFRFYYCMLGLAFPGECDPDRIFSERWRGCVLGDWETCTPASPIVPWTINVIRN